MRGMDPKVGKSGDGTDPYRARWSAIVEAAVDAIIVIDSGGTIQSFNPAAQRMFGYALEQVVGQPVQLLMPEPDRSRHSNYVKRYEQTGEPRIIGLGREVVALHRDGTRFPIHLSVGAFDAQGARGYVGIIHDISERRHAERELQSQRDRLAQVSRLTTVGEMASSIAHEVNQPLSAIGNYARALELLMDRDGAGPEKIREIVGKINRQSQRAGDVIRKVRNFAAKRETQPESIQIHDLIKETLTLAETDAAHHQRPLNLQLGAEPTTVLIDAVQFQQVLLNLVRNGLEAMESTEDRHAALTISTQRVDQVVRVHVIDRGVGVSKTEAEQLFSPFFSTKRDGMGLGLAISRSISEAYGGNLYFTANSDGPGSTFTVQLPIDSGPDGSGTSRGNE